jgi:outer membrane protein
MLMPALAAALSVAAQAPPAKIGTINIQQAIFQCKDGQAAIKTLTEKFEPRKKDLEAKQQSIGALEEQLRKSANTASEDQRRKLQTEIDQKKKAMQRDTEDAEAEFQQERGKSLNELGGRLMQVVDKYARDNNFSMILDVGSEQTPVLWIAPGVDITADVIALYDKNAPSTIPGGAAPAATKPAMPAKPTAAPAKK